MDKTLPTSTPLPLNKTQATPRTNFRYQEWHTKEILSYCGPQPEQSRPNNFWTEFEAHFNVKFNTDVSANSLKIKYFRLIHDRPGGNLVPQGKGISRKRPNLVDNSDKETVEKVTKFIEENPTDSYRILSKKLTNDKNLKISKSSVHKIAKASGIKSYKPRNEQIIPPESVLARNNLALAVLGSEFRSKFEFKITFVDESLIDCANIAVNKQTTRYKAKTANDVPASWHKKFAKQLAKTNLNCFAGIMFGRRPFIGFIDGHGNTDTYKKVATKLFDDKRFNFQKGEHVYFHDGAGFHYSRETIIFLKDKAGDNVISKWRSGPKKNPDLYKFINMPEYCSYSPDLNPVDYFFWPVILEKLSKLNAADYPVDRKSMQAKIREIAENIPQKNIDDACLAFFKRCEYCVQEKGQSFERLLK